MGEVSDWIEMVALRLLQGDRLLVRMAPRTGKTYLARELKAALGSTAILIDGRAFAEDDSNSAREALREELSDVLDRYSAAQLLFDGYDWPLARRHGSRLQSWLTSQLVDGLHSQDIGALFTARCSTSVQREGAGSSVMSRVLPVLPPMLTIDASSDALQEERRQWFGTSAMMADKAVAIGGPSGLSALADQLELDTTFIVDVRKAAHQQILAERILPASDYAGRCAAQGLLVEGGTTRLFEQLRPSLTKEPEASPAWPQSVGESVDRFLEMIAGVQEVIWSDRYMYRDIEPLREFLQRVSRRSECQILLLGSESLGDRNISRAEIARLTAVPGIQARWMKPSDYSRLHERHLVTGLGGWVIPQVHVIIGRQDPGSAVSAASNAFGVDYWSIWRGSILP